LHSCSPNTISLPRNCLSKRSLAAEENSTADFKMIKEPGHAARRVLVRYFQAETDTPSLTAKIKNRIPVCANPGLPAQTLWLKWLLAVNFTHPAWRIQVTTSNDKTTAEP